LQERDLLGQRTVRDATFQFHSLCEGLAAVELRETFPPGDGERIWRDALTALIAGFATAPLRQPPSSTTTNRRPTKRRVLITPSITAGATTEQFDPTNPSASDLSTEGNSRSGPSIQED
jgi:hypothetical protein